jgi:predicted MPP superfamily phosphohydrolase
MLQRSSRKGILRSKGSIVSGFPMPHEPARSPSLSRRAWLRATAAVGLGMPALVATNALVVTPSWLDTTSLTLGLTGMKLPATGTTASAASLLQLSDLHMKQIGRLERQLLAAVNASPPDLLLFTGDAIDTAAGLDVFAEFLAACPRNSMPIGILGNWEYRSGIAPSQLAQLYEQHGGRLLVNDALEVETAAGPLVVTGLDDLVEGRPQVDVAARLADRAPHLLLAHCPGQRDQLSRRIGDGVDLILSGHTHGGQVAPFGIALVTPGGSGRYIRGWYPDHGPPMYVSRGLGTSTLPIRLGVTPELVSIRWQLA